jgi:hypothetical protein
MLALGSEVVTGTDQTGVRDSLGIVVFYPIAGGPGNSSFRLYTTHSLPVRKQDEDPAQVGSLGFAAQLSLPDAGPFVLTYSDALFSSRTLLQSTPWPYRPITPMHFLTQPHVAPFFYQDSQYAFYVHPDVSPSTTAATTAFGVFPGPLTAAPTFPALTGGRSRNG